MQPLTYTSAEIDEILLVETADSSSDSSCHSPPQKRQRIQSWSTIIPQLEKIDLATGSTYYHLNRMEKGYQTEQARQILAIAQANLVSINAAKMGLGKTFVSGGIMASLISLKGRGLYVVAAPKSVLNAHEKDLQFIFSEVMDTAWHYALARNPQKTAVQLINIIMHNLDELAKPRLKKAKKHAYQLETQLFLRLISQVPFQNVQLSRRQQRRLEARYRIIRDLTVGHMKFLNEKYGNTPAICAAYQAAIKATHQKFSIYSSNHLLNELEQAHAPVNCLSIIRLCWCILGIEPARQPFEELKDCPSYLKIFRKIALADLIQVCKVGKKFKECINLYENEQPLIVLVSHETLTPSIEGDYHECLIVDEVQKGRNDESNLFANIAKYIKRIRKQNFGCFINFATGTSFENHYEEPWNLLKLGNNFDDAPVLTLKERMHLLQKAFLSSESSSFVADNLRDNLVDIFAQFHAFKSILSKLILTKTFSDADVIAAWSGRLPKREDRDIMVDLMDDTLCALKQFNEKRDLSNNFLKRDQGNKWIIFNHAMPKMHRKDVEFKQLMMRLNESKGMQEIDALIASSSLLTGLTNSEVFANIKSEKTVFFIDSKVQGDLIKVILEKKYGIDTRLFEGEMTIAKRDDCVSWFKAPGEPAKAKVLLLMIKAGGLGLNLPEAEKAVVLSWSWNPFETEQAIGRLMRVNSVSLPIIYHITFRDPGNPGQMLFFEKHKRVIREGKLCMEEFLFSKNREVPALFHLWCSAFLQHCFQQILNESDTMGIATQKMEEVECVLKTMMMSVSEKQLQQAIERFSPWT